ncbi:MAG: hypothetical protein R3C28_21140 [Pirellulaceae bacterium]
MTDSMKNTFIVFVLTTVTCFAIGYEKIRPFQVACVQPALTQPTESEVIVSEWRRTTDGWEPKSTWVMPRKKDASLHYDLGRMHPAVVASLFALVGIGSLLLLPDQQASTDR